MKTIDVTIPISVEGIRNFSLRRPNTDTILKVYDYAQEKKVYQAMYELLAGSILSADGNKVNAEFIRKIPLVSSEFLSIEIFKLFGIPTLVEGVYECPRAGCGNKIIHEETKDFDTRDDISALEINYANSDNYKDDWFTLDLGDEPIEILNNRSDTSIATVYSLVFRDPTIGDLINAQMKAGNRKQSSLLKELYHNCIVDGEVESETGELTISRIKNIYPYELLKFDNHFLFDKITLGLRRFGYYPFIHLTCPECGKEWESAIDFTSFFAYALQSRPY